MSDVVVAIPTFKRPASLTALLTSLSDDARLLGARLLVIDNDPQASARQIAHDFGTDYVVEPARGLAAVRNRALDEAMTSSALVFIDDDELPHEQWLSRLVECWRTTGSAAVSGRVESRFPPHFDDQWIIDGGFFRRVQFGAGDSQTTAPTNNLLLDLGFVRENGLRFDEEFGLSGGEDILFTKQLVRAGGRIVSCPSALVLDPVSAGRLTHGWVLRRAYRVGLTTVRTDMHLGGGIITRLTHALGGSARVAFGIARWTVGVVTRSTTHSARGARAAWRGAGMVMGAMGGQYQEYAIR